MAAAAVSNCYCCGATTVLTAKVETAAVAAVAAAMVAAAVAVMTVVVAVTMMTEAARNKETADGDIGRAVASDSRRPTDERARRNNRAFARVAGIRAVDEDDRDGRTLSWKKTVAAVAVAKKKTKMKKKTTTTT